MTINELRHKFRLINKLYNTAFQKKKITVLEIRIVFLDNNDSINSG